jgi:hypothetical protein
LTAPTASAAKFYRVAISDVDSDGVGLNDWEKYQLGLDPTQPWSNGQQDANGNALSDYAYVTNLLASQNVITIAATDPTAHAARSRAKSTADRTVHRHARRLSAGLHHGESRLGGPGSGFATPAWITARCRLRSFWAGREFANHHADADGQHESADAGSRAIAILPGANYTVGAQSNASVVIYPSPTASGTGLLGQYYTNSSTTYTNSKNFNPTNLFLTRIDPVIDFIWTNGTSPNLSNGFTPCAGRDRCSRSFRKPIILT